MVAAVVVAAATSHCCCNTCCCCANRAAAAAEFIGCCHCLGSARHKVWLSQAAALAAAVASSSSCCCSCCLLGLEGKKRWRTEGKEARLTFWGISGSWVYRDEEELGYGFCYCMCFPRQERERARCSERWGGEKLNLLEKRRREIIKVRGDGNI